MIIDYIHEWTGSSQTSLYVFYIVVLVLSIINYKLGFAKKLPILKSALIYVLLALGAIILTILGLQLPVAEIMVIGAIILAVVRLKLGRNLGEDEGNEWRSSQKP